MKIVGLETLQAEDQADSHHLHQMDNHDEHEQTGSQRCLPWPRVF